MKDMQNIILKRSSEFFGLDIDKLKEAGFDNHLTKPFKIDGIQQAIQDGFDEFRKRAERQSGSL